MTSEGIVQIVAIKDGAGTEKRLMKDIKDVNYIKKRFVEIFNRNIFAALHSSFET